MSTIKKLTATILIICMFLRLPESEAKASEAADDFITAATNVGYPINISTRSDCTGIYSLFSPCYTLQITTMDNYGDGSLDIYDTDSRDHALLNDEDRVLPWDDELEQPQVGFLIPILHF
ncbi:MAG: hypothetical protein ACR2PB_14970 [Desulfocapsaceae bacterium]